MRKGGRGGREGGREGREGREGGRERGEEGRGGREGGREGREDGAKRGLNAITANYNNIFVFRQMSDQLQVCSDIRKS